jgi:hypothetical protein
VVWLFVPGLAFPIGCGLNLSSRIERHSRDTAQAAFRRSAIPMDQMERLDYPSPQAPQAIPGVVLEFRRTHTRRRSNDGLASF